MQISPIGIWNSDINSLENYGEPLEKRRSREIKGYTLIELIVVVVLLGLIFTFVAPRFRDAVLTDSLKTAARKLVIKINGLRVKAIQDHIDQLLRFDLEQNEYWRESKDMSDEGRELARETNAECLPDGVRITDIWVKGNGKRMGGEVAIRFTKKGYAQHSAIHLESEDGREFTLVLSPFLPRVKVYENYIEFEDTV